MITATIFIFEKDIYHRSHSGGFHHENQFISSGNSTFAAPVDGNHAQRGNSNSVTTTINVTGVGCVTDGSFVNGNGDQFIISR
jgi:hypothetical protein